MKTKTRILTILTAAAAYGVSSCDKHGHQHGEGGHDHDKPAVGEGGGGGHVEHSHATAAGPNGGRVLTEFEPHAEFLVTEDRKVRITFLDDDQKAVAAGEQMVSVTAGRRENPTQLAFTKDGDTLVSDGEVPAGDNFPVVVQIKAGGTSESSSARFQCNLEDCPTCDYKEYACVCDHAHDD